MNDDKLKILVIGGTGHVGGALIDRLAPDGRNVRVRAMVRQPDAADLPGSVEVVYGDLADPNTVAEAVDGIDRVFLVWPLGSGELVESTVKLLAARVHRVVYLSAIGVDDDGAAASDPILQLHTDIEQAIGSTDLEWTFVRSGGMATNTLGWAQQIKEVPTVAWVYGDAARSLVHEADLAEIAEVALTTDRLLACSPEITGPTMLTQERQASVIGRAIGRTVAWRELPVDEVRGMLMDWGWSEAMTNGALAGWASMVDHAESPTSDFETITGKTARTFEQWAIDHTEDFS